ncbi:MAG: tetratricopeptide repeat protein [Verrucomicrobiota bacterium]|nr:tetratricopeptide repeat protein [Verrucomicrobiota bacterium]
MPAVAAHAPPTNLWILSGWRDLLLYVGTPLLLIPLYALAQGRWSAQDIYIFVGAFGAFGHHLPGMIRAYGDRALFERFRWRFILAPLFLVGTCISFYVWDLKGVVLVLFFWGVWHGMMQTYGFCRIYDAKTKSFAAFSRRLDFATCAIWFAAGVVLSSERMGTTLEAFYASGGPFIPEWVLRGLQQGLLTVAIATGVLFIGNFVWMWRQGQRANPVKIGLLATSISFWWYCNNGVTNILAGIALFEVFHDVQYLSLVWIYNRNRVEKDSTIGGFMRFIFRRSGSLLGLYVGLVFAYGAFAYLNTQVQIDSVKRVLTGVVAASGLLHFYYDGFIWKMRESSTRASLGLTGGSATMMPRGVFPSWMVHGLKWVVGFVVPVGALCLWQVRGAVPQLERYAWVAQNLPAAASHHDQYAEELAKSGRYDEAVAEYEAALKINDKDAQVHAKLGRVYMAQSKFERAAGEFATAINLDPKEGETHYDNGYALKRLGRPDEASREFENAAHLAPKFAPAHVAYGSELAKQGRLDEAIAEYRAALKGKTVYPEAHVLLANALVGKGDLEAAEAEYLEAERLAPQQTDVFNSLGELYLQQGKLSQASGQLSEAVRLDPNNEAAAANLQRVHESEARFGVAGALRP